MLLKVRSKLTARLWKKQRERWFLREVRLLLSHTPHSVASCDLVPSHPDLLHRFFFFFPSLPPGLKKIKHLAGVLQTDSTCSLDPILCSFSHAVLQFYVFSLHNIKLFALSITYLKLKLQIVLDNSSICLLIGFDIFSLTCLSLLRVMLQGLFPQPIALVSSLLLLVFHISSLPW